MKIVKTAILAMAFLLLFGITSFGAEGIVTANSLKLRKEPSLNGEVLYGISKNKKVEILEKTDDKWYKVKYNGDTGYVSAEYIMTEEIVTNPEPVIDEKPEITDDYEEIEESKIYKTSNEIDIYILPVINSSITNKLDSGVQVNVIKIINKWAYIESNSIYGWVIYSKLIAETIPTHETPIPTPEVLPVSTPEVTPEVTEKPVVTSTQVPEATDNTETSKSIGYINVSTYANLRKEPSTDAKVLDTLLRNTEVVILSEENGWNKVKVNGITGFVSKDLISNTKLEEIDTSSRGTNEPREPEVVPEPTVTPKVEQVSSNGEQIIELAKKYLGYKYVYGGTTPTKGFDCSGFVYYIFGEIGKPVSRSLSVQAKAGVEVSKSDLKSGDIVIFNNSSNSALGHVGIYIGNSQFIHAANPDRGVVIDYLDSRNSYYNERYVTARRV